MSSPTGLRGIRELLGRRTITEAASQHTDCIGELTASLRKRSPTSPRCVLLPGPAGPFLLKDAARPRLVSHTDDWIGCAKILRTARKACPRRSTYELLQPRS